jgi:hypothetical protein
MAATRPSIMSDGATTSAPASAWATAIAASRGRVGPSTTRGAVPPGRGGASTPQWPWSV